MKQRSSDDPARGLGPMWPGIRGEQLRSLTFEMGRDLVNGSLYRLKDFACRICAFERLVRQGSFRQLLRALPQGGAHPAAAPGYAVCMVSARTSSGG